MRVPLEALVASMPNGAATAQYLPAAASDGIYTSVTPDDPYIVPDTFTETPDARSPVVLIAAPGAMGKSSAARYLAAGAKAVYVDLARLHVGSGSLTGELTKAFDFAPAGRFVSDLKAGHASLVLDSTDEAQLGAGRDNYLAFLSDLSWLLRDATAANQVVLLGRPDASDTTHVGLLEVGLEPVLHRIAPLTQEQAARLIDGTLDRRSGSRGVYTVHRQHTGPFGALRDSVFRSIADALYPAGGEDFWPRVEDFLGYPPVVLALAERLAVENPSQELASEAPTNSRAGRGELLRSILERILEREQKKVGEQVGNSLAMSPGSPERTVLYDPEEQISRLLAHTGTVGINLDVPASLDEGDRQKYEEYVEPFVADHPFLKDRSFANVVFQDYARAWAVSSTMTELYAKNRTNFLATLPAVGPFFSQFLHALTSGEQDTGQLPEELVDDAIKSFALGTERGEALVFQRGEQSLLLLHVGLAQEDDAIGFEITERMGIVVLRSPLARVAVMTDGGVILEGRDGPIDIGPGVTIVADEIELQGKSLTALGPAPGDESVGGLNFLSTRLMRHAGDLKVGSKPAGSLMVSWPDAWHQWKPWTAAIPQYLDRLDHATISQSLVLIRRILIAFHRSMGAEPSVSADKMDHIIVGDNVVAKATFESLLGLGIITRVGMIYLLHLDELGKHKITYADLKGDDPINPLRGLLSAIVVRSEFDSLRRDPSQP